MSGLGLGRAVEHRVFGASQFGQVRALGFELVQPRRLGQGIIPIAQARLGGAGVLGGGGLLFLGVVGLPRLASPLGGHPIRGRIPEAPTPTCELGAPLHPGVRLEGGPVGDGLEAIAGVGPCTEGFHCSLVLVGHAASQRAVELVHRLLPRQAEVQPRRLELLEAKLGPFLGLKDGAVGFGRELVAGLVVGAKLVDFGGFGGRLVRVGP